MRSSNLPLFTIIYQVLVFSNDFLLFTLFYVILVISRQLTMSCVFFLLLARKELIITCKIFSTTARTQKRWNGHLQYFFHLRLTSGSRFLLKLHLKLG